MDAEGDPRQLSEDLVEENENWNGSTVDEPDGWSDATGETSEIRAFAESSCPGPFTALQVPMLHGPDGRPQRGQAAINFTANMLGVSILGLPWAMAQAGVLGAALALALVAWASRAAMTMLMNLSAFDGAEVGKASYPEIGRRVVGPEGQVAVLAALLLYSGGLVTCQLAALADILESLAGEFEGQAFATPRAAFVMLAVMLSGPVAVLKTIPSNVILSLACLGAGAFFIGSLLLLLGADLVSGGSQDVSFSGGSFAGFLLAATVFVGQLSAHGALEACCFDHAEEIGSSCHGTPRLQDQAQTRLAYGIVLPIVAILALAGYLRFGREVRGDVLLSWSIAEDAGIGTAASLVGKQWQQLARIGYAVVLIMGLACASKPCRASAQELFASRRRFGVHPSRTYHRTAASCLGSCACLAWMVRDLDQLLLLLGAFGAAPLCLLLPAIFTIEMARRQDNRPLLSVENLKPVAVGLLGLLLILTCIVNLIGESVSSPAGHRGKRVMVHLANITNRLH
eukprot:TRINITY_DN21831_c0_g1_i1.p1 TRINITY_DN21831_c0_g1~~TRINITY_DN21831_c0_g1_i1.p1  ORF type:complete len:519 (-),score=82.90 TRINITY_DN21831_c0_g1_i1:137-1672(-)